MQIKNLQDYSKCSNFAKYDWNETYQEPSGLIYSLCRDALKHLVDNSSHLKWESLRSKFSRQYRGEDSNNFYKSSIEYLHQLRVWHQDFYKKLPTEGVASIQLETLIEGIPVKCFIPFIFVNSDNKFTVVDWQKSVQDMNNDLGIRTKIYLLYKENIRISYYYNFSTTSFFKRFINISDSYKFNSNTQRVLFPILKNISANVFYPSITTMCNTCKYKKYCSWS